MQEFELRDGRVDEGPGLELVLELLAALTALYHEDGPSPPDPQEFASPYGSFLVGFLGGDPAACGGFRRVDVVTAELKRMFVRPAHRGRGLSRKLLTALEQEAARRGYRQMILETGNLQTEALALYRSSGYQPMSTFEPYLKHPASVCLSKPLTVP